MGDCVDLTGDVGDEEVKREEEGDTDSQHP